MKLSQILNSQEALKNLSETTLPAKVAYKIRKLLNRMQPILSEFEGKRADLVHKLGKEDEVKKQWEVTPENIDNFRTELQVLVEQEVNLSFSEDKELEKIKIEEFEGSLVKPSDLLYLDWLVE